VPSITKNKLCVNCILSESTLGLWTGGCAKLSSNEQSSLSLQIAEMLFECPDPGCTCTGASILPLAKAQNYVSGKLIPTVRLSISGLLQTEKILGAEYYPKGSVGCEALPSDGHEGREEADFCS
jgi:hypothetical protein